MANDSQGLTLRPATWCAEAERWLSQALAGASLADLRDQVEAGASLFHVVAGDQVCGAFLLRVDQTTSGPVGVIVAGAGDLPGVDLVGVCVPAIERLFVGVRRFRYHTARPALARKLARQGYAPREIVCFKESP
jgi:hypothetical protein